MMIIKTIITVVLTIGSGALYRMGGSDKYNTKARDIGVALCSIAEFLVLGFFSWWLVPYFGMLFGSLTTYWKRKGMDVRWYNWFITGFFYALSAIVYPIATGQWQGFIVRMIVLPILIMIWSVLVDEVEREEGGRGGLIILTQPLLLWNPF